MTRAIVQLVTGIVLLALCWLMWTDPPPTIGGRLVLWWFIVACVGTLLWIRVTRKRERERDEAYRRVGRELWDEGMPRGQAHRDAISPGRRPVRITRKALTRVNVQRRMTGRKPLSPQGFRAAIRAVPEGKRIESQNDWLLWFVLYDAPPHYTTIPATEDPGAALEIFHPHGGAFGGAGASASWSAERLTDSLDATGPDGIDRGPTPAAIATAAVAAAAQGDRQTFEVPPGYVAVRDSDGRATGHVVPDDTGTPSYAEYSRPISDERFAKQEGVHYRDDAIDPRSGDVLRAETDYDSGSSSSSSSYDSGSSSGGDSGGGGGGGGD